MELLVLLLLIFDIYIFYRNRKLFNRNIRQDNKILFYKLQKNYLNNSSTEDIKDLICFLYKYLQTKNDKNNFMKGILKNESKKQNS